MDKILHISIPGKGNRDKPRYPLTSFQAVKVTQRYPRIAVDDAASAAYTT